MKSTDESHPLERQLKRACTRYNMAVAVWWWAPPGQYVALGRKINWGQYCTSGDKNLHRQILNFFEEISSTIFCNLFLKNILSTLCFIYIHPINFMFYLWGNLWNLGGASLWTRGKLATHHLQTTHRQYFWIFSISYFSTKYIHQHLSMVATVSEKGGSIIEWILNFWFRSAERFE